jgi:hypothetical protein
MPLINYSDCAFIRKLSFSIQEENGAILNLKILIPVHCILAFYFSLKLSSKQTKCHSLGSTISQKTFTHDEEDLQIAT